MTTNIHDITTGRSRIVPPLAEAFVGPNDEVVTFLPGDDIARIGAHLIEQCPELAHLTTANIDYLWRRQGGKSKGQFVLGKCELASSLVGFYTGHQFIVWLGADTCREFLTTQAQFEALVFDKLMRAEIDEETSKPTLRSPDVVTFNATLERYGCWTSELKQAAQTFVQAPLVTDLVPYGAAA